jgi:hypothetical protein
MRTDDYPVLIEQRVQFEFDRLQQNDLQFPSCLSRFAWSAPCRGQ